MEHNEWFAVRMLSESDSDQILELVNLIQPHIPWNKQHLRWQYFESPGGNARLYGINNQQGQLISFYAAVAQISQIGNRLVTTRMVQDVMTHPDYRGRGFLHQLGERCLDDIIQSGEAGYTLPNEKSAKSFRRIGWTELCSVPWRKKYLHSNQEMTTLAVSELAGCFDRDVISSIWQSNPLFVGVNRDAAYLNWRYNKPRTKYSKFLINRDEGLIILKMFGNTLHICDLLTRSDRLNNVSAMLNFCDNFGLQHGANILTAWLPDGHPYGAAFHEHGLKLITDVERYIFVHPGKIANEKLLNPGIWHITQGDSDIY